MLSSPMLESRNSSVRVADADPADFLAMLRFVYLGELTDVTPPQQLPGVLQLAHRYDIKDLVALCCGQMVQHVSCATAVEYVRTLRLLEGVPMALPPRPKQQVPAVATQPQLVGAGFLTAVPQ